MIKLKLGRKSFNLFVFMNGRVDSTVKKSQIKLITQLYYLVPDDCQKNSSSLLCITTTVLYTVALCTSSSSFSSRVLDAVISIYAFFSHFTHLKNLQYIKSNDVHSHRPATKFSLAFSDCNFLTLHINQKPGTNV